MSRASLPVDWGAIQAFYIQGVSVAELCKRYGVNSHTLNSRAWRNKWAAKRANQVEKRKEEVTAAITVPAARDTESVSTQCREWFERDIQRVMDRLDVLSPVTLNIRELDVRQGVVKGLYGMVSEMLDWNGEQRKTPIQSQLLARLLDEVEGIREKRAKVTVENLPPIPAGEGSKEECLAESATDSVLPSPADGGESKGSNIT